MTIRKRNNIRWKLANQIATIEGRMARMRQLDKCEREIALLPDNRVTYHERCGERAYEDAARSEFSWLLDPRARRGVPELRLRLAISLGEWRSMTEVAS